jgi:hypothetical protein
MGVVQRAAYRGLQRENECLRDALRNFVDRALAFSERLAQAATRGEVLVVEQQLKMLQSLRAEAERYGYVSDDDAWSTENG